MKTILLDTLLWDLVVDVRGNIALASEPYALAQDAASAVKTFLGEVWYDTTLGVPYQDILGKDPQLSLLKAKLVAAAEAVPGVVSAAVFITSIAERTVRGQVQVRNTAGNLSAAAF